jgi:hypothetical protein
VQRYNLYFIYARKFPILTFLFFKVLKLPESLVIWPELITFAVGIQWRRDYHLLYTLLYYYSYIDLFLFQEKSVKNRFFFGSINFSLYLCPR